jgi:hypothetical protein
LSAAEVIARHLGLSKKKLESDVENSMKFLSSQNKMLSAVMFCGISSVRYKNPATSSGQYEPFPNNCYTEIKDIVRVKKDRLVIVSKCVLIIKDAIQQSEPTSVFICELLAKFALAIIITNLEVFVSNLHLVTKIFLTTFSNFPDFKTALDQELSDPDVNDTLNSPIISQHFQVFSNVKYYQDIATDIESKVQSSMSNPRDDSLYFDFLATLNNYILKDENNKCVSTAQERSVFQGLCNLTLYILNNVIIPNAVFNVWRDLAPEARVRRSNAASVGASVGEKKGGRRRKKIIQTGGDSTDDIINKALEVNLNDDTNRSSFVKEHDSKTDVDINGIIQTQLDPSVLRHLLTGLKLQREKRIAELDDIILKMGSSTPSASPVQNARHSRPQAVASTASAAEPAVEPEGLFMLILERNEQQARLSKETFMNEMLQNVTSEQDKEYYWKTRNELVLRLRTGISLTIVEKTVLEMSDIEMLVCLYAGINDHYLTTGTTSVTYLRTAYDLLSSEPATKPLTWFNIEIPGRINELYTQYRQQYYPPHPPPPHPPPPPNQDAISITNYLLYGEDISNPENIIGDDIRIITLFMLHIFLNEVIMDMIPDSYGESLVITEVTKRLLEKTYTISSSIDSSNYTAEQIQKAKDEVASMSVSSGRQVNPMRDAGFGFGGVVTHSPDSGPRGFGYHSPGGSATQSSGTDFGFGDVGYHSPGGSATPQLMDEDPDSLASAVSVVLPPRGEAPLFNRFKQAASVLFGTKRPRNGTEPGGGKSGGSTARTRRKLHRNHRRTQYTNKHKRSAKSSKRATIKHRKSYRKHNRTIKRRKNSHRK